MPSTAPAAIRTATLMAKLRELLSAARDAGEPEAEAASLATVDASGQPSARVVYAMLDEDEGPVVFMHADSGKARHLAANPAACLHFWWPRMSTQVIVEARARVLPREHAEALWLKRPRDAQLGAWASALRGPSIGHAALRERAEQVRRAHVHERIPMPPHWQACLLEPQRLTIWPGGWHRLQPRQRYYRDEEGTWHEAALNP